MKKALKILIVLSLILITSYNPRAIASSKIENTFYNSNGYNFEIQTDNESYQKIKITNDKTQEIEYLEVVKEEDGSYSYKSTSEAQILELNTNDKKALVTDLHSNEINTINIDTLIHDMDINTSTTIQPLDLNDGWNFVYMYHGDRATQVAAGIGAVTAVIGYIIGGGILSAAALYISSTIVSLYVKQVYYTVSQFTKQGVSCDMKDIITFYSNSDRTNFLGTETKYWAPSRCN